MVVNSILKHKGDTLTYHQCISLEEAKENELPEGVYFFWMHGNRKILNPFEIVQIVLQATKDGSLDVQELLNPKKLKAHYETLHQTQLGRIKESLTDMKTAYTKAYSQGGMDQASLNEMQKHLDTQIEQFDRVGFPQMDGLANPNREQAEVILGGKENVDKFMSPELQKKVFGG